jgi:hypothetical protein
MGAVRQFSLRNDDRSSAKQVGTKSPKSDPFMLKRLCRNLLCFVRHQQRAHSPAN